MDKIDEAYIDHVYELGFSIPNDDVEPYKRDSGYVGFKAGWNACDTEAVALLKEIADSMHKSDMSFANAMTRTIEFLKDK